MKEEAPNYLKIVILTVNKPSEQGITIYQVKAVEQIVSSISFPFYPK